MSKYSKLGRVAKCGSADSKYMSNTNKLEQDLAEKEIEHRTFKDLVRHLVLLDPSKMDLRFKDLLDVARELKQEFDL